MTATARDMVGMLRRHYIPDATRPGGIFLPEIPAPGSNRRADLIWQGVTASGGNALIGHEVKVTRADVLVELADPTKADAWLRYCNRWWLVVSDPALIDGLDLPPTWGVLAPPSGRRRRSCTVVRPAPALRPTEQGPALRAIATRLHWEGHNQSAELDRARRDVDQLRDRVRQLERLVPNGQRSPAAERRQAVICRIVDALGGPWTEDTVGGWDCNVEVEQVVTALRDLGELRSVAREIEHALRVGRVDMHRHVVALQRLLDKQTPGADQDVQVPR